MDYMLRYPITSEDVDFLNETTYEYELFNPTVVGNDSGWCDMGTGARIITVSDRVIFRNVSPQQFTILKLKYTYRLKPLTGDIDEIYNEAQAHNAPPLSVVDSETIV